MTSVTAESGLSVSVESSPRTPPTWSVSESDFPAGNVAPLKKGIRNPEKEILRDDGGGEGGDDGDDDGGGESISPRVLWEPKRSVARQLDFSAEELSPIPADSSILSSVEDTVGDCSVCYLSLPVQSNHVFTVCGHLFCVNCFLTWWDIAINCPVCRANLFVVDDNPNHNILDNGGDRISE